MYKDIALWSYIIGVLVSGFTCFIYSWWLVWVLRMNRKNGIDNVKIRISKPYIYDTILFAGIFLSMSLTLYGRYLLLTECIEMRDSLITCWLWDIRNWVIIVPLMLIGVRAYLRIRKSLPRE